VVWRPESTRRLFTLDDDDGEHWFDKRIAAFEAEAL
jgi:hypothetical protein